MIKIFLKKLLLPNLNHLGFEILAFYPIKFNPSKAPKKEDIEVLDTYSTIFLASRQFETVTYISLSYISRLQRR